MHFYLSSSLNGVAARVAKSACLQQFLNLKVECGMIGNQEGFDQPGLMLSWKVCQTLAR